MNPHDLSRRDALKLTSLAAAAAALGPAALTRSADLIRPARPQRARSLRIAHLTDLHVEPERRAADGAAAAFAHANALPDKPDLIITGGDHVYDSCDSDETRAKVQWDLFTKSMQDHNTLPVLSCLGNHDCWGWNKKKSKTTGDEPLWGKKRALDQLKMPGRYYSVDKNGWHLTVLDSIQPSGDSYMAKVDDEQFEWLKGDLASVKSGTPIMVISHIPILAVCLFFNAAEGRAEKVDPGRMHTDTGRLKNLFLKHAGLKLCISGHIHLLDRCEYDGVTYLCNGAVSGNWWKGRHQETDEGYALIDLFDDGTFDSKYQTYGWEAQPAK